MPDLSPWVLLTVGGTLTSVSEFSLDRIARVLNLPALPVAVSFCLAMEIPLTLLRHEQEALTCSVRRPNGDDARDYTMGTTRYAVTPGGTLWALMELQRVPFSEVGWHTFFVRSAEDDRILAQTAALVRLTRQDR